MGYWDGERRQRVAEFLQGGTQSKLMRGSTLRASCLIQEAYELASQPTPLESPWPEVCAYRLAHLLLRQPQVDCERAQQLFAESARLEALGPWPLLYRMALLQWLGRHQELPDLWEEAFRRRDRGPNKVDSTAAGLRSNQVTALELMACCSGQFASLTHLNGLGLPVDDDLHPIWSSLFADGDCAWRMYGPTPRLLKVVYPYAAALAELESFCQSRPDGFFFILSAERPAQFWHQAEWFGFPQKGLLELLAVALSMHQYDNATLAESLGVSDGALRVRKTELHNFLRPRFPKIGEVPPWQLDIFGIVQHGALPFG